MKSWEDIKQTKTYKKVHAQCEEALEQFYSGVEQFQHECWTISASHGFQESNLEPEDDSFLKQVGNSLMLIVGEVSEAHEELRKGKAVDEAYYREDGKPEGVPFELADIVIRVADFAETYGIDLSKAIKEKMEFNKTRPYKHGKKF